MGKSALQELRGFIDVYWETGDVLRANGARMGELSAVVVAQWRGVSSWEEERTFVEVASWLAMFEGTDTEVCSLLVRALGRIDTEKNTVDASLIADQFVRSAVNTNGDFRKYRCAARASSHLSQVPDVRRYIL